jgi:uncharacterized glyoxalase superfamily protein PhnB
MMQFAYTILYVRNVETSMQFYEAAFDCSRKFISPANEYGELATGATTLSFATIDLAKTNLKQGFLESHAHEQPFGIEIGFTTKDVDQAVQQALRAGATLVAEAQTKPWGQVVAYVRDPDGFLIEICTSMD